MAGCMIPALPASSAPIPWYKAPATPRVTTGTATCGTTRCATPTPPDTRYTAWMKNEYTMNVPYMVGGSGFAGNNWYKNIMSQSGGMGPGSGRFWSDKLNNSAKRDFMLARPNHFDEMYGRGAWNSIASGQYTFRNKEIGCYVTSHFIDNGQMKFYWIGKNGRIRSNNFSYGKNQGGGVMETWVPKYSAGENSSNGQTSRQDELIRDISFGTGLFTTMVGEAARGIKDPL
jgi:hypothetical protein